MDGRSIKPAPERISTFQVITLILSIYVLVALFAQSVLILTPETSAFIDTIDFYVCLVFLADFFFSIYKAPSKARFLKWGWVDLISSIPMLDIFRYGRVVRMIRIFRILRALRSTKNLVGYFIRERRVTSLTAVVTISVMFMFFSSIAMLQFETSPESNIKTPSDALWWACVTITTVGYGDKFPVTAEGRIVACLLMMCGVGLFGTMTGFVASLFVEPEIKEEGKSIEGLTQEVQALREVIQSLESKINNATQRPK